MRVGAAAILVVLAIGSLAASWGALRNLFGGSGDSRAGTYVLFGVPWLIIAGVALALVVRLWRRP